MSSSLSGTAVRQPDPVGTDPLGSTGSRIERTDDGLTSRVPSTIVASAPPPPPANEPRPTPPSGNHVWVPGHFTLLGNQWSWVNGAWAVPPAPGAVWVNGRYDPATRRWTEGHWDFTGAMTGAIR